MAIDVGEVRISLLLILQAAILIAILLWLAVQWHGASCEAFFRSALPRLDPKRVSKWAAALELAAELEVEPNRFSKFVSRNGGIEGCNKLLAANRRKDEGGL